LFVRQEGLQSLLDWGPFGLVCPIRIPICHQLWNHPLDGWVSGVIAVIQEEDRGQETHGFNALSAAVNVAFPDLLERVDGTDQRPLLQSKRRVHTAAMPRVPRDWAYDNCRDEGGEENR